MCILTSLFSNFAIWRFFFDVDMAATIASDGDVAAAVVLRRYMVFL
jgi:hypothetical protein